MDVELFEIFCCEIDASLGLCRALVGRRRVVEYVPKPEIVHVDWHHPRPYDDERTLVTRPCSRRVLTKGLEPIVQLCTSRILLHALRSLSKYQPLVLR